MRFLLLTFLFLLSFNLNAKENALYSFITLETSKGPIKLKLFKKDAPRTVANFVGLATGRKPFRDVKTGKKLKQTPFYQNMIFHKVHPNLGIQTGCPWGNGKGWPGFTIKDEKNNLKFDRPFLVTMAKIQGSESSIGSQFLITTAPQPHLDGKYTVFGEVISGKNLVTEISKVKRDAMMRPLAPIYLKKVEVDE